MKRITITLDLPPATLSPNARCHWAVKSRATKEYRANAYVKACQLVTASKRPKWKNAELRVTWYHKDRIRRDPDNLIASLKAGIDGLRDAGILADDRGLVIYPATLLVDPERPRVELELSGIEEDVR